MALACPFFMPTLKAEQGSWPHPSRLPLGAGWKGYCTAKGHADEQPDEQVLRDSCNLGYASNCAWRPSHSVCDTVRFAVKKESESRILITFVCEKDHRPGTCGVLEFDVLKRKWPSPHPDSRIQRMADCFVESYFERRQAQASDVLGQQL